MLEDEDKGEKQQEITPEKIIDPKEYTEKEGVNPPSTEGKNKPEQAAPTPPTTTPEAPPQYNDHVVAKAVNKLTPALINKLILKYQGCEKITETEMQETGLGEACAWFIETKFPNIQTNTPTAAAITASLAVIGLTASKHPKFKKLIESAEQQAGA
ncbi:MAG: hypothetical protein PHH85_03575 [Candidatus Methanoperedens sp.]|nr:hypothetical protein [Candidatus Methanoperedens sp.]